MMKLDLKIQLLSPTLPGSGEGWGSLVDTDIIMDEYGLPYLPARRIKGLLRESAVEVMEMLALSKLNTREELALAPPEQIFGTGFQKSVFQVDNLKIEDHDQIIQWLDFLFQSYGQILSPAVITEALTEIRRQTSIDEDTGVARENSLRTIRVINQGISFTGTIFMENSKQQDQAIRLLALAVANLKRLGSKRTRGLGRIEASLWHNSSNLSRAAVSLLRKVK